MTHNSSDLEPAVRVAAGTRSGPIGRLGRLNARDRADAAAVRSCLHTPSIRQVLCSKVGVLQNLTEQPSTERPACMDWYRGATTISMPEHQMTSALPDGLESMSAEYGEQFPCRDGREMRAHTATRTFVAPTSW